MKEEFRPQLSDREANRAKGQRWKAFDEDVYFDGPAFAKRAWSMGWINNIDQLLEIPIGSVLKTGVSAYERVQ